MLHGQDWNGCLLVCWGLASGTCPLCVGGRDLSVGVGEDSWMCWLFSFLFPSFSNKSWVRWEGVCRGRWAEGSYSSRGWKGSSVFRGQLGNAKELRVPARPTFQKLGEMGVGNLCRHGFTFQHVLKIKKEKPPLKKVASLEGFYLYYISFLKYKGTKSIQFISSLLVGGGIG